ncbi:ArsR/SmtB family transcription factor [Streptomyces specialis]|uniref:ArsR/SmtB family transcription factor n=1 Tax=Streptomyces specialis TaxID=498367 RepID=UPI00073F177A|nr:helix-turn-helix domain-containing protein [Streptomyces specialis]
MTDPAPGARRDAALDARGLRALAHPVRVRLLGLLREHGPATATQLARRMDLTSGATSYHLRRLGEAGFVDEDTGRGNARERWWRPVHRPASPGDPDRPAGAPGAAPAYPRSLAAVNALRVQRTLDALETMPEPWRHAFDLSDVALRLTPAEARRLRDEVRAVVAGFRRDTPEENGSAPAGSERVVFLTHVLPEPADRP